MSEPMTDRDTFEMRCDTIETTSISPQYEPDHDWQATDAHGHAHQWGEGRKLPTLVYKYVDGFNGDGDEWTDSWYECATCGEVVEPGYKVIPGTGNGYRTFAPGMVHYLINGVEVDQATYQARVIALLS